MLRTNRALLTVLALTASISTSCRPGKVADATRPEPPPVQSSLCDSVADFGQPLIVDLKAHERAVYEAVMKDGVAVVSYDCDKLRLIKDCRIDGDYGFVGVSPKEEVVRLEGADEIQLNLPTFGAKIAAEVQRDASLDLGLILIGMRRTTVDAANKQRLKGNGCERATHFVRGAFVGAFALKQGSSGSTRGAVEIMGAGASASSRSSKRTENRDGDARACKSFNPSAQSPDPSCAALLRLELTALDVASKDDAGAADVCPKELVLVDGKCAPPTAAEAFQCREGQLSECVAQCDKGHAGSCAAASFMYFGNHGVPADPEKAASLAAKACEGGSARGCGNLGHAYDRGDSLSKDMNKARELYSKSCDGGWPRGCSNLGVLKERDGDAAGASALFDRACSGGEARACHFLALNLDKGHGIAKDTVRAKALFTRACQGMWEDACGLLSSELLSGSEQERAKGLKDLEDSCGRGSANACSFLGSLRLSGTKLPRDPARAAQDFERACEAKDVKSCADAARLLFAGRDGVTRNGEKASRLAKRACDGGQAAGCRLVAVGHLQGLGVVRDDASALKILEKACADGDGESCGSTGLMYRHGFGTAANPSFAVGFFDKGCQARHGYSCALLASARYDGAGVAQDINGARSALGLACSAGYSHACGLSAPGSHVYAVSNDKAAGDPFRSKHTMESARTSGSGVAAASESELEKRRNSLRSGVKSKLGALKTCPADQSVVGRVHRLEFAVGLDGKTQIAQPTRSAHEKFGACVDKAVRSVKIASGKYVLKGSMMLRLRAKNDPQIVLSIDPDPSELTLPLTVRRLAGCSCGEGSLELVCAIECRTGTGPAGHIATVDGGQGNFENVQTAPAGRPFDEKQTRPSSKPFSDKHTKPAPPKKNAPPR